MPGSGGSGCPPSARASALAASVTDSEACQRYRVFQSAASCCYQNRKFCPAGCGCFMRLPPSFSAATAASTRDMKVLVVPAVRWISRLARISGGQRCGGTGAASHRAGYNRCSFTSRRLPPGRSRSHCPRQPHCHRHWDGRILTASPRSPAALPLSTLSAASCCYQHSRRGTGGGGRAGHPAVCALIRPRLTVACRASERSGRQPVQAAATSIRLSSLA